MATHTINRVAIYARISTANHGQDVSMQTRELRDYCDRRGWTVVSEYVDTGISGAKDRRPELDRLMTDAHKRRFDVVVVWKFDRFARSVSHLLRALDTFRVLGVEFVSLSESQSAATEEAMGFLKAADTRCTRCRRYTLASCDKRRSSLSCPTLFPKMARGLQRQEPFRWLKRRPTRRADWQAPS